MNIFGNPLGGLIDPLAMEKAGMALPSMPQQIAEKRADNGVAGGAVPMTQVPLKNPADMTVDEYLREEIRNLQACIKNVERRHAEAKQHGLLFIKIRELREISGW